MAAATTTARTQLTPAQITKRIGSTTEAALAYVDAPDPELSRLSRKVRENLLPDLPPVVAGALLGPAALARHFVASAAAGRYRDLFALWQLFRAHPDEVKPVLADRPEALAKARTCLRTSVRIGLRGRHTDLLAADVAEAQGLIWTWMRELLVEALPAVGARPAVASILLAREPDLDIPLPDEPDERWLGEAAAARATGPLAPQVEALLAANASRLPATIDTLTMAAEHFPDALSDLVSRIDLDADDAPRLIAWARDHGHGDSVLTRAQRRVEEAAYRSRAEGIEAWAAWRRRNVAVELPGSAKSDDLSDLDLSRPEVAELIAVLVSEGHALDPQHDLEALAAKNRQQAEKAFESMVCAGLDVTLPDALVANPLVKEGTRCPACRAWTWVRPGHESRCPRLAAMPPEQPANATPPGGEAAADEWSAAAAAEEAPQPAPPTPGDQTTPDAPTAPAEPESAVPAAEEVVPEPEPTPPLPDPSPPPPLPDPPAPQPPPEPSRPEPAPEPTTPQPVPEPTTPQPVPEPTEPAGTGSAPEMDTAAEGSGATDEAAPDKA